jgi:NADH:ubiquinone oxidoreductase subunit E
MIKGGRELFKYVSDKLGVKNKETTSDGMFTIEEVECLGSCESAPMMQVNNKEFYENLTKEKIDKLLEELHKKNI